MIQLIKRTKLLPVLGAAVLALAMSASVAQAQETPNPGYTQFEGCPSEKENSNSKVCIRTDITGGHFQMGTKDVPINKTLTLTGGVNGALQNFVFNSKGGLTKVPLKVPGGVVGLTGLTFLLELFGSEALTLYATTEGAGIPDVNIFEEPVELPVKVHLTNPAGLLGNNCRVGSFTEPIKLNLITGTTSPPAPNKPITGVPPTFEFDEETEISLLKDGTFVDNSFAAPGANGCVLTLFGFIPISINGLVNSQAGLPSAAGKNETVQEFDVQLADSATVY